MSRVLRARRLLTDVGTVEFPVLRIGDDGRIAEIESDPSQPDEGTLATGFFDVHTHGAAGHDVMSPEPHALPTVARFLASRGVTHFLPTTVTAPLDDTLRALERLGQAVERGIEGEALMARPLGIHLEGPFVSHAKRGVHPPEFILQPSVAAFDRFWEASHGQITLMTIAPEEPGAMEVIEHATALGVKISIGHSNAVAAVAREGIARGATSATHTFNAMRALDHREPGILGVVLDDTNLYAEMICDGVHVAAEAVRLWFRAKAPDRGILITDSMAATGMPDGEYTLGGMPVTVRGPVCMSGGALAGSVLTMDRAVARLQEVAGASLEVALRAATTNPLRMTGKSGEAVLRAGAWADLNRFDATGLLVETLVRGRSVALGA